jgi:glycosyltransferase involved in cell wall biosynthesis
MIHLFINALAASAGGGLTYIRNVLPRLALRNDVRATVLLSESLRGEFNSSPRLNIILGDVIASTARRFRYEQSKLPALIRNSQADVLLSAGNFALLRSSVPQILLSGNALYTSRHFERDLRDRGEYALWIDNAIKGTFARWSVSVADCTVAPSKAFAADLRKWTGKNVLAIYHGFDREIFFGSSEPLAREVQAKLDSAEGSLKLLFVSHYNYYRNFETLFRALAILRKKIYPRSVRLFLTCKLTSDENPGNYRAESAATLVRELHLSDEVIELGAAPYRRLHHIYAKSDFYVTPAYVETFAHPLVEAMASGLPVIAADLAVHREICGAAAMYFSPFSAEELARTIVRAIESREQATHMSEEGLLRSQDFSWAAHIEAVLKLARLLAGNKPR